MNSLKTLILKLREITKGMQELHFSTINLRNKLSKGRVNNNCPIITQVTGRNNMTTAAQVRVEIYPPTQSCWWEIGRFLHKEMNLCIKAAYYETLNKNEIYLPWTIAFQSPQIWCPTRDKLRQSCHWEKSSQRDAHYLVKYDQPWNRWL